MPDSGFDAGLETVGQAGLVGSLRGSLRHGHHLPGDTIRPLLIEVMGRADGEFGLHRALRVHFSVLTLLLVVCAIDMARHHALHPAIAHRALQRQDIHRPSAHCG